MTSQDHPMSMHLSIQHLQKSYKRNHVLRDICLEADAGTCIGILGANGSGKSTLLSVLSGIDRPDEGVFTLDGQDLFRDRRLCRTNIGYILQGTPLFDELTALEHLKLWYSLSGKDLSEALQSGIPALMGIPSFLNTPARNMSGGMKKRLSIACAAAHDPRILLMDEPSGALDLICKERIGRYIDYTRKRGGIILLVTHDVQELSLCDRLFILKAGILTPYTFDGDTRRLSLSLSDRT